MTEHSQLPSLAAGSTFTLEKAPVTTAQLVMYAGASGDFNRIHYDLPFTQAAGLGGIIAHGMLTMGFAGQLVTGWAGPAGMVRELSARFLHSVRPGDAVVLTGTVQAVDAGAERSAAKRAFRSKAGRPPA